MKDKRKIIVAFICVGLVVGFCDILTAVLISTKINIIKDILITLSVLGGVLIYDKYGNGALESI